MSQSNQVVIGGKSLVCDHCGNDAFNSRKAQLNTAQAMFFNVAWLNESASVFVCSNCGRIYWFLVPEGAMPTQSGGAPFEDTVSPFEDTVSPFQAAVEPQAKALSTDERVTAQEEGSPSEDHDYGKLKEVIDSQEQEDDAPVSSEDELDENYDIECMQCGQKIPAGRSICAKCGWTYKK